MKQDRSNPGQLQNLQEIGRNQRNREQPERWKEGQDCWCPSRYVEGGFQVIQPGVMARDAHAYPSKQHGALKTVSSILLNEQILQ